MLDIDLFAMCPQHPLAQLMRAAQVARQEELRKCPDGYAWRVVCEGPNTFVGTLYDPKGQEIYKVERRTRDLAEHALFKHVTAIRAAYYPGVSEDLR